MSPVSERLEVDNLLREAEQAAETAANRARILISLTLLVTVFIIAGSIPEDPLILAQIKAAKVTLGLWLLVGLAAAMAGRLGIRHPLIGYGLVTVDALLLAGNVFFGILVADLAGNFWSLFPAIWLIPLAVAATALRWNPKLTAYAGALLVGLVLAMSILAGYVEGTEREVQLARLPLLFGWSPNAVRLVMLSLTVGVVVALTWRGRALVMRAVTETSRRLALGRHVPRQILPLILDPALAAIRDGSKRSLGILFVDIRGSTALSERLEPQALAHLIVAFRGLVETASDRHHGVVDKFIGDGALVLFGVLPSDRNIAADAIGCGRAMLEGLDRFNAQRSAAGEAALEIGVGVHFGEVFVGVIGQGDRLEFTALGEAVNLAARLEKATRTQTCRILVSQSAMEASATEPAAFGLVPRGAIALEGVSHPQTAYGEIPAMGR